MKREKHEKKSSSDVKRVWDSVEKFTLVVKERTVDEKELVSSLLSKEEHKQLVNIFGSSERKVQVLFECEVWSSGSKLTTEINGNPYFPQYCEGENS